jgi:hypothetical protein
MTAETEARPEIYVNGFTLSAGVWDFVFDFSMQAPDEPRPGRPLARIRMSPQHALAVSLVLQKQLAVYQEQIGPIKLPAGLLSEMGIDEEVSRDA